MILTETSATGLIVDQGAGYFAAVVVVPVDFTDYIFGLNTRFLSTEDVEGNLVEPDPAEAVGYARLTPTSWSIARPDAVAYLPAWQNTGLVDWPVIRSIFALLVIQGNDELAFFANLANPITVAPDDRIVLPDGFTFRFRSA